MWSNSLPAVLGRWGLFAGLLMLVGAWGFRVLVAREGNGSGEVEPTVRSTVRGTVLVGGIFLLVGIAARLGVQVMDFVEPTEPLGGQVAFLVGQTFWGRTWLVQCALAVVAVPLLAAWLPGAGGTVRSTLLALVVLPCAAMPALSGHAVASENFRTMAIVADTGHILASGLWLGTLLALVVAALRLPSSGGTRDGAVRRWVEPFHRLAMASVAVVLVTGLFATWLHASPAALVGTRWGNVLLVKSTLVGVVLLLGWKAGWKLRTELHRPGVPGRLVNSALLELIVAQLVLIATAVLVALSPVLDDPYENF